MIHLIQLENPELPTVVDRATKVISIFTDLPDRRVEIRLSLEKAEALVARLQDRINMLRG